METFGLILALVCFSAATVLAVALHQMDTRGMIARHSKWARRMWSGGTIN